MTRVNADLLTVVSSSALSAISAVPSALVVWLGRFLIFKAQFSFHLVADLELLDFAGDGLGKGIDKFDVARDFVVGELGAAELADLVGGR